MSPGIAKSASTSEMQNSKLDLIQYKHKSRLLQCINSILEVF